MKKARGHRSAMAWAMLLTLLIVGGVKATHFHDPGERAAATEAAAGHCADDCVVCHFVLAPFVVADPAGPVVVAVAPLVLFLPGAVRLAAPALPTAASRGPPACASWL